MTVVDDYLKNVSEPQKSVLEHVRQVIKQAIPDAEDVITYAMPGFKYKKRYLVAFNAFKDHMSIFPGAKAAEKMAAQLKDYKVSKGTIQFTTEHPLSDSLIQELIRIRAKTIDESLAR